MSLSRIMLAATKSGSGKTTITCSLLYLLKQSGLKVRSYKCGPDYIDPMFHKNVLGIESKNLDLFFTDEETTRDLFLMDNDSDISVVEGVMGLYDGLGGIQEEASSYHLARTLKMPIILIIDAHGMGRSIAAEINGFKQMDEENLIKGVILNRTSKGFCDSITPLIENMTGVRVLGYVSKQKDIIFDSRHLGLVLPHEVEDLETKIENCAKNLLEGVNLDAVKYLAEDAPFLKEYKHSSYHKSENQNIRIGIAMDEGFCFYYSDNIRMLEENNASIVPFSPIHDKHLPDNLSGLILGGGYPEIYAKELSENISMRNDIKTAINNGIPTLAECGGFMYLHDSITTKDSKCYQMVGAIDGDCSYTGHLVRFGYITLEKNSDEVCCENAFPIKGHEFHYFESSANGDSCIASKPVGNRHWECGYLGNSYFWSFAHLYYPSNPDFVKWYMKKCYEYGNRR